jgi:hypothetical protein
MTNSTKWVRKLFNYYIKDTSINIYFEEKDKLQLEEKVINLSIHPIRFADDIFFNFETNDLIIKEKLKKYEVDYDIFYNYANMIQATYLKTVKKNNIKENSLLLIGQTSKDKVIFNGQKYLSLIDYLDEIKNISKDYNIIYYKPHPYENSKDTIKELKKSFKNIIIVYDNIYYLLSNENIKHVIALNSSVLYEAKYFNKQTTFLYKPYFDFSKEDIGIYINYFDSDFWSDILEIKNYNIKIPNQKNRLRKILNDFWGYTELDDEIILKDIFKSKIKYFFAKYF